MIQRILCFLLLFCSLPAAGSQAAPINDGLSAALKATLTNHPAIKGKLAELSAQGFNIEAAKAGRYPNLTGQVNKQDDGMEYGTLQLRQPLWAFGKIDVPIAQEKERLRAEELSLLQIQRTLLEETAATYALIQGIRQRIQVADENISEHRKLYDRIERRQAGQLASDADVRLAFSRLTQAESQREQLAGELQIALDELQNLTQVESTAREPVDPALSDLPERAAVEELAFKENADIHYKKQLIEVTKYNVTLEKIASTPTLYAEAQHDFFDSTTENDTWVGLRFEGGLNGAGLGIVNRVKSASAQLDAARQDWRSTSNDVKQLIGRLLTSLAVQTRLQLAYRSSAEAVQETRESFLRQYDTGRKSWLDVLNIQRELTEQRLQLVQADSDRLILSLRLCALIGQLDSIAGLQQEPAE